ncbi:RHS repeat-associated protein [Chryseobacterium rhizosphaerae]|uniref:DUF6531 domain-containing protein n=1 Tax=Chryseobacterium rhizosphaerae TaxID=395937 RepID=UPI002854CA67|nr:DUF6531 domain-containing protein [Chryseobacterium rhizosphaerae]MDR6546259.1 RHS repeat-associated protein [Chryseobacterium rhizosphaerae]
MSDIIGKVVTSPAPRKGFGELFGEAKNKLDHLQKDMASILPAMPGMPVGKYFDLAIGIDFHETIFPPMPLLPVPHIGMVFDIMSAIMNAISSVLPEPPAPPADGSEPPTSLASVCTAIVNGMKPSVQVHGQWVANAGTGIQHLPGIFLHIPFPIVKPIASSEMFLGSSTVLADGGPCSTQFHLALSCNLIGIPAPFRITKPKPKVALMAPTSMLLIMTSAGKPVLAGGPPTIDLFQLAMSLGLKGMGKLWKKAGNKLQDAIDGIKPNKPKLAKVLQPVKCRLFGEPVDAATGRVYSTNTDVELPGPIPFVWQRTYYSDAEVNGPLGFNWHHSYHMGLFDLGNNFASLRLSDGREVVVPLVSHGEKYFSRKEQLTFSNDEKGYLLTDSNNLRYRFNGALNKEGYRMLSSISRADGFIMEFQYHPNGCLKQITDSTGKIIKVESDADQRITRLYTISENREITYIQYKYDELGNMIYNKDVIGAEKHFYYNHHLLIQLTNQTGQNFYWEYEGKGDDAKCIHTWGDGGVLEYFTEYNPGQTITRNSLGFTTEYFYDDDKLIYKIIDENGGVTHQKYNQYQELELTVNAEGLTKKYLYTENGLLKTVENENNETTQFQYDDVFNLTKVTTPGGTEIEWSYDDLHRIIKKKLPSGEKLFYQYENRHLRKITDSNNRSVHFFYDKFHRMVQVIYPNETYNKWDYDEVGNVICERDVRGNLTYYKYDDAGNTVYIKEPDGNEHYFEYDTSYNIIHAKDDLHEVHFRYGSLGVLLSRTQNNRTVKFAYDTELQLKNISNEKGEVYRFALDGVGNVINEWGFDGLHRRYERDAVGRVKRVIRPDNRWTEYDYDGTGNVIMEQHSDLSFTGYHYNKDGFLSGALNQDITIKIQRAKDGRILKEQQGQHWVSTLFDEENNSLQTQSSLGADITSQYDHFGQVREMESGNWKAQWQYDATGLEIQRELTGGISQLTERDQQGRVIRSSINSHNVEQNRTRYFWGTANRLLKTVNEITGASTSFNYDSWDNLVSGNYQSRQQTETIYKAPDAIGNLFETPEQSDRMYGAGGRLLKDIRYNYYYDAEGNLIFKEFRKSSQRAAVSASTIEHKYGISLTGSGIGWQYEWKGNGMLAKVILPKGSEVVFFYDPLGRRIAKQYKNKVTRWVWDGNVPLHEWQYEGSFPPELTIDAENNVEEAVESAENVITWLYKEGSFTPCGKIIGEQQFSIISDYLGTPTHAYNRDGILIWERELDIYGSLRKGDHTFVPFLYQGQYIDEETGLAYNRFRYYDNESGNYISQDPIGLMSGEPNLYAYVKNVNSFIDIFGWNTIIPSENLKSIDLTDPNWRNLSFDGNQKGIVYILKDADTGEFLKIGKSEVGTFKGRFEKYATAGNKTGRNLSLDVFTVDKTALSSVESIEKSMREGLEKMGYSLPWDNTLNRLGRSGPGTPFTRLNKKLRATHEWDAKGNLKPKHVH